MKKKSLLSEPKCKEKIQLTCGVWLWREKHMTLNRKQTLKIKANGKEDIKLFLFAKDMPVYVKIPRTLQKNLQN